MIDQSFSTENFRIILDYENRKSIHLEDKLSITSVKDINFKLKDLSKSIRKFTK